VVITLIRTSFAGALAVIAIGAVLAFAIPGTPKDFDLQTAGVILVVAGAADLFIRSLISDSPLLGRRSADVAAVVEPLGEPVLDAAGNPVAVPNPASPVTRPPLVAPLPGTMPEGSVAETIVVTDQPYEVRRIPPQPSAAQPPAAPEVPVAPSAAGYGYVPEPAVERGSVTAAYPEYRYPDPGLPAAAAYPEYQAAVDAAAGETPDTPQGPAVTTLGGRPVRPRGRGFGRRRGRR
jgi:hypothetical protein